MGENVSFLLEVWEMWISNTSLLAFIRRTCDGSIRAESFFAYFPLLLNIFINRQ